MKEKSTKNTVHERIPIEGTPFTMIKHEKGYTIVMGTYALTPTLPTKKAMQIYMAKNEWNLIINVIHAMLDFNKLINTKELIKQYQNQTELFNKEEK